METNENFESVLEAAKSGDETAQEQLVKNVTIRIRTYIYRSTLNQSTTDDILQEVFCKMFESLCKLRDINAFWPWVYRIASNCTNNYYRSKSKFSKQLNLQDEVLDSIVSNRNTSDAELMNKELSRAVIEAVSTLTPRHRQMVTLRCFEDMSFKEIGQVEDTSEMYARVIFHRAIEKLRLALKKKGFSTASILVALSLFGKITASSEAAAATTSVSASAVSGTGASLITAKLAQAAGKLSVHKYKTCAGVSAVAAVLILFLTMGTLRSNVTSAHYYVQGVVPVQKPENNSSSKIPVSSERTADRANIEYSSKGIYEYKVAMPDGPEGAVLLFAQRWNRKQTGKLCSWLQDGSGNYYYASGEKKIYITNDPYPMFVFPTDPPELTEFVYSQLGFDSRVSYKRKLFTGLLKSKVDNRVGKFPPVESEYKYNSLEISDLPETWPKTDKIEDVRDEMHKRGWTSFQIDGLVDGKAVTGIGQIPFVYNMYSEHKPWISVKADKNIYIDYPGMFAGASCGKEVMTFENESFFEGFCRPWEGIPCKYSVMRDAAKRRLRFSVKNKESISEVTVYTDTRHGEMKIVYGIDTDKDVIVSILYVKGEEVFGQLYFDYMQDAASAQHEKFTPPQTKISDTKGGRPAKPWLVMLAEKI